MERLEQFRLPRWFKRDGANAPLLEVFWQALASSDPDHALAMIYLAQASGRHLDVHGRLYGVARLLGESDAGYRRRLLAELRTPRSITGAIIDAIQAALPGVTATVTNPFAQALEVGTRFFNGTWNFGAPGVFFATPQFATAPTDAAMFFVDITGPDPDPIAARAVIERIRAAGYIPTVRFMAQQFDVLLTLAVEATAQQFVFFRFNGLRRFDGTWNFNTDQLGPEQPIL